MRPPTLNSEVPLTSREDEMDRIRDGFARSEPVALVLAGPAGVGKTRLSMEAGKEASRLGFSVTHVIATRAAAAIPFGPFVPFLPTAGDSPTDMLALLRHTSQAIVRKAGPDRKLLLIVDDAQFLDEGSAALVHQLVAERTCSLLASLRTPGPAPDPVTALWKDGLAERIDLGLWGEQQTGAVLSACLGGPVASVSVRRIWQLSQGNALYLRELIIGAVEEGALREVGGIWSLVKPLTPPGRLNELVAARLSGLADTTIAVVELLAAGEPLSVPLLERITDPAALEEAEAHGLAHVSSDGRRTVTRLAHPVYGEALRSTLPRSRLRRISATLADALVATGTRRRDDLLRLARWQLDSGRPGDADVLTGAARRAAEMFDMTMSERFARAALDAGGGTDAGLLLGEALFRSGRHREAETVLASMVPRCETDEDLARIASARAHNFHNLLDDQEAAMAVLHEALDAVTGAKPRLQLLGRLATIKVFEPDPAEALEAARPLLASDDDATAGRGAYVTSIALAQIGKGSDSAQTAYTGLERHRRVAASLVQLPEAQLIGAVMGHLAGGRLAAAQSDAETGSDACLTAGDKEGRATFLLLGGCVLIERGMLTEAAAAFLDGTSINRELHDVAALRWCLAGVALAEAMRGHTDRAQAAARERDELPASQMRIYDTELVDRSRAWVWVCGGELSRACAILTESAARAAARQQWVAEARVLHDVARLGQAAAVAPRLAELASVIEGEFAGMLAMHADALVKGDGPALEAAAAKFETIGAALLAAEAYLAAAASYRSDGQARAASAMTRRAAELAASCGDVRTPGLSLGASTDRLTKREREVAALAAAGASSREIADRLFLSVRTVDNHLQNVYSKLGVSRRDELAQVLSTAAARI